MDFEEEGEEENDQQKEKCMFVTALASFIQKTFSINLHKAVDQQPLQRQRTKEETKNDKDNKTNEYLYGFQCTRVPNINFQDYLLRISKYAECSEEALILATVYLFRLHQRYGDTFPINVWTIHRVFITSVRLAVKFFDDLHLNNQWFATIGGIPLHELNILEVDMLYLLEFGLFVSVDEYRLVHGSVVFS